MKVRSPVRQKTFLPKSTFCADGSVSYSVGTTPVYNRILGEMRAEAESNRGPSAYQPDTLPVGQTGSPPGRALRLHLVRSFCLMSSDAKEHIRDSYNCCWWTLKLMDTQVTAHIPSIAFRHLPPEGRKNVVNQCLEFGYNCLVSMDTQVTTVCCRLSGVDGHSDYNCLVSTGWCRRTLKLRLSVWSVLQRMGTQSQPVKKMGNSTLLFDAFLRCLPGAASRHQEGAKCLLWRSPNPRIPSARWPGFRCSHLPALHPWS